MKYLKLYESHRLDQLKQFCETHLAFLIDEGYEVTVYNSNINIVRTLDDNSDGIFKWIDVCDYVIPFLEEFKEKERVSIINIHYWNHTQYNRVKIDKFTIDELIFDSLDKYELMNNNISIISIRYGTSISKVLENNNIYNIDWKTLLPNNLTVIEDGGEHIFKLGNIMKNSDMVQVTYINHKNEWGITDNLEFDFYFHNADNSFKMDVDITWGELMANEFSITAPSEVSVIEYTSFNSKTYPGNIFAFEENSLNQIVEFLNQFNGIKVHRDQFNFLDTNQDSYYPD